MTNKECEDSPHDSEIVDLLASHVINQILDEASVLVSAAKDSGQPWSYISSMRKIKNRKLDDSHDEVLAFVVSEGGNLFNNNNQENVAVTSTPERKENKAAKLRNEVSFMGQGDEELEVRSYDLRKTTSMFITHLFDMSDVELVCTTDTDVTISRNTRSEELLVDVNNNESEEKHTTNQLNTKVDSLNSKSENSSYSFLNDALCDGMSKDINLPKIINDTNSGTEMQADIESKSITAIHIEIDTRQCVLNDTVVEMDSNDLALFENAYSTMNRDYEQYSEEEETVIQNQKEASMHEVDLIATTSNENATLCQVMDEKGLNATSGVLSSGTGSRKSNIVRRCRNQGAKLLSCLKGWWLRRKLLGKRKNVRVCASIRGICPLSPDARRRASSLLDQRDLRTPSPSRSIIWKFNTVNEAIVHSSRWRNFDPETNLD